MRLLSDGASEDDLDAAELVAGYVGRAATGPLCVDAGADAQLAPSPPAWTRSVRLPLDLRLFYRFINGQRLAFDGASEDDAWLGLFGGVLVYDTRICYGLVAAQDQGRLGYTAQQWKFGASTFDGHVSFLAIYAEEHPTATTAARATGHGLPWGTVIQSSWHNSNEFVLSASFVEFFEDYVDKVRARDNKGNTRR